MRNAILIGMAGMIMVPSAVIAGPHGNAQHDRKNERQHGERHASQQHNGKSERQDKRQRGDQRASQHHDGKHDRQDNRQHDQRQASQQHERQDRRQHDQRHASSQHNGQYQWHNMRQRNQRQALRHRPGYRIYAAPVRNWRYRPLTVGYRLQPSFYGSRYYVNDYNAFQLRSPGRYQRWIRYGNDLVLVNVRTGHVLQVLHDRYW